MRDAPATAFIWYHAEAELEAELQRWVRQTGHGLSIGARLMIRRQADRTTFMEIYELPADCDPDSFVMQIEQQAGRQPWFERLQSPRRAELFTPSNA